MRRMRLPAKIESLEPFRAFVMAHMEAMAGMEGISPRVDLALEEILVNVIGYAYEDEGFIEVECSSGDPDRFLIIVKDWGVAFNPLDREAPDLSGNIATKKVGGLGIHLVRHMVSELKYERKDGVNVLTLVFENEACKSK
jgi:anti-sigma regulatory factor (Ser/Thr protein kinase)